MVNYNPSSRTRYHLAVANSPTPAVQADRGPFGSYRKMPGRDDSHRLDLTLTG